MRTTVLAKQIETQVLRRVHSKCVWGFVGWAEWCVSSGRFWKPIQTNISTWSVCSHITWITDFITHRWRTSPLSPLVFHLYRGFSLLRSLDWIIVPPLGDFPGDISPKWKVFAFSFDKHHKCTTISLHRLHAEMINSNDKSMARCRAVCRARRKWTHLAGWAPKNQRSTCGLSPVRWIVFGIARPVEVDVGEAAEGARSEVNIIEL